VASFLAAVGVAMNWSGGRVPRMSAATVRGVRPWAIAAAVILPWLGGAVMEAACVESRRSLGEDCLKNEDCLSGICSQLQCGALPTTFDAAVFADGSAANANAEDAATDAVQSPDSDVTSADELEQSLDAPSSPADTSIDGDSSDE
jgi:hypothetical protein